MTSKRNYAYVCPIIIGVILILVGLLIRIPGGALTTYEILDGEKTEYSIFDDRYSAIDEYVGGDAYNYIIGAALVAGKIAGTMTTKTIYIVGGALCICLGITLGLLQKKEAVTENNTSGNTENTVKVEEQVLDGKTCPCCGHQAAQDARFCTNCGKSFEIQ